MTEITDLNPTDAANTEITGESLDGNVANMGRMDNTLQAVMGLLARSIRTNIWRVLDNSDDTKELALDLSGLTTATTRTLTVQDKSGSLALTSDLTPLGTKVDTRRNRIVNHDMRMSQENGTVAGTANGYFAADQWATYRVTSAGTITSAQVASTTPDGSPNRYRVTITTADASLAAGEYLTISQNLEGSNVVDFRYGSAAAKASVLRFGFKGPAGTYAVHLGNSAANRSFVALFTIAGGDANVDTVQTISIPGDTTGTWLTADGVIGITLDIVLAAGSTFQGVAGWQAGNILGTSAVTNGMGTISSVFELFDVGLRLDPDATGVYGQYEVGETDAVYRSERYWRQDSIRFSGNALAGSTVCYMTYGISLPQAKLPTPAISGNSGEINISSVVFFGMIGTQVGINISTTSSGFFRTAFNSTLNARLS
jgi:hypothetical protein